MLSLFLFLCLSAPFFYVFRPLRRTPIRFLICLHTLILVHTVITHPPPNIFTRLHQPLATPADALRALLLKYSPEPSLPKDIEQLLGRLNSFDSRTLYVRFGHDVVAKCEYCHTYGDFALYALPKALMAYLREVAVIGVLTLRGTGHEYWRTLAVCAVLVAAGIEGYLRSTAIIQIQEGEPIFMWNDNLEICRVLFFIALPLIIECALPLRPASSAIHPAEQAMQSLLTRLQALKYYRGAILRSPILNRSASVWWGRQRQEGEWIRTDERVRAIARVVGIPYEGDNARLRENAHAVARDFVRVAVPSGSTTATVQAG